MGQHHAFTRYKVPEYDFEKKSFDGLFAGSIPTSNERL
jgi:hypothetical protein